MNSELGESEGGCVRIGWMVSRRHVLSRTHVTQLIT